MAKETRTRRAPISGPRNILTVKGQEPGYKYRVVNDVGDRINELQEIGYELVTDKNVKVGDKRIASPTAEGSPIRTSVGVKDNGEPMYAYVMRIKEEWYKEDQDAKQRAVDEQENSMKQEARRNADYGKVEINRD